MNQHSHLQHGTATNWSGTGADATQPQEQQVQTWDAMESYFECITTCSLDDGECVTHCVEQLRERS
jgi:hypothetical protein